MKNTQTNNTKKDNSRLTKAICAAVGVVLIVLAIFCAAAQKMAPPPHTTAAMSSAIPASSTIPVLWKAAGTRQIPRASLPA